MVKKAFPIRLTEQKIDMILDLVYNDSSLNKSTATELLLDIIDSHFTVDYILKYYNNIFK